MQPGRTDYKCVCNDYNGFYQDPVDPLQGQDNTTAGSQGSILNIHWSNEWFTTNKSIKQKFVMLRE